MSTEQGELFKKFSAKSARKKPVSRKCATRFCRGKVSVWRRKNGTIVQDIRCSKCKMRQWRAANPLKASYTRLKHNAKRRGKPFLLTFEQFCTFASAHGFMPDGKTRDSVTIDRIDPSKGYEAGNLQLLTNVENLRKRYADPF